MLFIRISASFEPPCIYVYFFASQAVTKLLPTKTMQLHICVQNVHYYNFDFFVVVLTKMYNQSRIIDQSFFEYKIRRNSEKQQEKFKLNFFPIRSILTIFSNLFHFFHFFNLVHYFSILSNLVHFVQFSLPFVQFSPFCPIQSILFNLVHFVKLSPFFFSI